jgi:hypothetical protein
MTVEVVQALHQTHVAGLISLCWESFISSNMHYLASTGG